MDFAPSFYDQYADRLQLAVTDINMGLADIKARLAHIAGIENLTVAPGTHGGEVYQLGDQTVEVPAGNAGIRSRVQLIADGLINAVPSAVQIAEVDQAVAQADPIAVQVEVHKVITGRTQMSAIDRIKDKALKARGIAPQAIRDFEADLDGIIAEEAVLASKRAEAVAPHREAFAGIYSEFDGLKSAMDILSNGAPPLEGSKPGGAS